MNLRCCQTGRHERLAVDLPNRPAPHGVTRVTRPLAAALKRTVYAAPFRASPFRASPVGEAPARAKSILSGDNHLAPEGPVTAAAGPGGGSGCGCPPRWTLPSAER